MQIELTQNPKNVTLIEGFPGFGLVSTIATEFLIDHLKAKRIGRLWSESMTPMVAVHGSKVVDPLGIFYDAKNKIVIVHALTSVAGMEWKIVKALSELYKKLQVKEVISIEGVGSMTEPGSDSNAFYYSENPKKWEQAGIAPLKEGIVMGVTGALLINIKGVPLSCIFAETHSKLPDSRAAAKVIEVLDKYLGLNLDYHPLIKKAEEFESKIKGLMDKTKKATDLKTAKEMDYVG